MSENSILKEFDELIEMGEQVSAQRQQESPFDGFTSSYLDKASLWEMKSKSLFRRTFGQNNEYFTEFCPEAGSIFHRISQAIAILRVAKDDYLRENTSQPASVNSGRIVNNTSNSNSTVFVIHGHDFDLLHSVELLLHRVGCSPLIFSQVPKIGSETNIEVLERIMPQADAVLALLTPDDEGRKKDSGEALKARARQNVLVEAGYAIIQRRKTSLIVATGDVTIPSDFDGINRVQGNEWSETLAKRLAVLLHDLGLSVILREV